MTVYTFDGTMDGLLSAVFDSFYRHQQSVTLLTEGDALPLFADAPHAVVTDPEKAARVWAGLERRLSAAGVRIIALSWLSEDKALSQPLFNYICKVFTPPQAPSVRGEGNTHNRAGSIEHNASDPDVLTVRNTCRRVLHEEQRMKQFIRFQKAKDGTYLAVISPDHNVLPLITEHFQDRFNDQPWLIYDARRHYGYHYDGEKAIRITFEDEHAVPFDLGNGKLDEELLSDNDRLLQDLWRTYFKAICIRERLNPRKQLNDMPRRYWKYMTEKN